MGHFRGDGALPQDRFQQWNAANNHKKKWSTAPACDYSEEQPGNTEQTYSFGNRSFKRGPPTDGFSASEKKKKTEGRQWVKIPALPTGLFPKGKHPRIFLGKKL